MVDKVGIPEFIDTLVVFIKQEEAKAKRVENAENK